MLFSPNVIISTPPSARPSSSVSSSVPTLFSTLSLDNPPPHPNPLQNNSFVTPPTSKPANNAPVPTTTTTTVAINHNGNNSNNSSNNPLIPNNLFGANIGAILPNHTPDSSNMVGEQFVVTRPIGKGSFAQVHAARHVSEFMPKYAVKVVKKTQQQREHPKDPHHHHHHQGMMTASTSVADPEVEVLCMKRAQGHPNIVKLHCVSSSTNHLFLVQDFMQGGDLFDEIVKTWERRGGNSKCAGLTEEASVKYFVNLLDAVAHLHSLGIAHRDIKPENMFLSRDKAFVQLGDFGFATTAELVSTRCGTLDYVAPEVLESAEPFDPKKTDVWSCAVVLYSMLTARLPFSADCKQEVVRRIKARDVKFPPGMLSSEAIHLLLSVFRASVDQRPSAAQLRKHPLILKYFPLEMSSSLHTPKLHPTPHHHHHHHHSTELTTTTTTTPTASTATVSPCPPVAAAGHHAAQSTVTATTTADTAADTSEWSDDDDEADARPVPSAPTLRSLSLSSSFVL